MEPIGFYTVIVVDANGCQANFSADLPNFEQVVVVLEPTASLAKGSSIQLSPVLNIPLDQIASVNWSPADGLDCTDCLSPTVTVTSIITYTVTVTSVDGCTASASITISVTAPEGNIYVPNAFSPNDDGINDVLTIFANDGYVKQVISFQVFTRWGESVYEASACNPTTSTQAGTVLSVTGKWTRACTPGLRRWS
ncbi:MAG: gliding motility-associated C-terminal domain-containing protein [Saprospiraceae bacterium]|nr:gliding motility-associated C-terminal domain-containing protein [Saprospiraceae bacterium]